MDIVHGGEGVQDPVCDAAITGDPGPTVHLPPPPGVPEVVGLEPEPLYLCDIKCLHVQVCAIKMDVAAICYNHFVWLLI